jgi:ribonuclease HI
LTAQGWSSLCAELGAGDAEDLAPGRLPEATQELPECTPRALRHYLGAQAPGPEQGSAWEVRTPAAVEATGREVKGLGDSGRWASGHTPGALEMVAYTDGSLIPPAGDEPARIGAAVVCDGVGGRKVLQVHTGGTGLTHTINRAELAALHQALLRAKTLAEQRPGELELVTVYTDSLFTILATQRWAGRWGRAPPHLHAPLLDAVREAMSCLSQLGTRVEVRKVKSHVGVVGNEEADQAAKAQAQGRLATGARRVLENTSDEAYEGLVWPAATREPQGGAAPRMEPQMLADLKGAVRKACAAHCEQEWTGPTPRVYADAWRGVAQRRELRPETAARAGPGAGTFRQRLPALNCTWGTLWTAKRAALFGMSYMGAAVEVNDQGEALCPLCHRPDSAGHAMGGCLHPDLHALYTARHDGAGRLVHNALALGKHGAGAVAADQDAEGSDAEGDLGEGTAMLMDMGRADALPEGVAGKGRMLRRWLTVAPRAAEGLDKVVLTKPDFVLLPGVTAEEMERRVREGDRLPEGQRITLIELGYGTDTRLEQKREEKSKQHADLANTLRGLGFTVAYDAAVHCVPLGHGGAVPASLGALMKELGVSATVTSSMCTKLAQHAARMAHAIVVKRRQLENKLTGADGQAPRGRAEQRGTDHPFKGRKRKRA